MKRRDEKVSTAGDEATTRPTPSETIRRLLVASRPYAAAIGLALLCSAILAASRFARAYLVQPLVDDVLVPAAQLPAAQAVNALEPRLLEIGLLAALTIVATPIGFFGRNYLIGGVVGRVRRDLDQRVAHAFLRASIGRLASRTTGDRLTRALADTQLAANALSLFYRDVLTNAVMVLFGVSMLFATNWRLAALVLATAPLFVLVVALFGRRIRSGTLRRQATQSALSQRLLSILSGARVIKAFGGESLEEAAFARQTDRFLDRHMTVLWNRVLAKSTADAAGQIIGFVALAIGAALALRQSWGVTLGSLSAFAAILISTQKPVKALTAAQSEIMEYVAGAERLFELLDRESPPVEVADLHPMTPLRSTLRLRDVSFARDGQPVLESIDLEVERGEVVAIAGRTGAGKSTLLDLLLRFHEPDRGAIEVDGRDVRDIARASYLQEIALVEQNPFLFDLSIADNIRYGDARASDEAVRRAARSVQADAFIEALPRGYETVVGEFGERLSGGQRQRIALARALLRPSSILILDEPTSALDAPAEERVQFLIQERRGEQTIFVVSHSPAMIRAADRCLLLDSGRLVACGPHADLLRTSALYRELMREASPEARTPRVERPPNQSPDFLQSH